MKNKKKIFLTAIILIILVGILGVWKLNLKTTTLEQLKNSGHCQMMGYIIKTDNDKIFLGGYLFLMYGKEITALIGGMDDEYIDLDVSYSIHFKMLKKAMEYGYRSYNFYEVKDVNDGGFFFKQNFGAKLFEHIGEFDYPIDLNSYKKYKKYFPLYYGVKSVYKNK